MPKAIIGETDLWTTSPNIAAMLVDKDIGYHVTSGSHKKAGFICPDCGTIIHDKIIRKVCTNGLKCPVCSDGISYPEKLMSCLLTSIGVDYVRDSGTEWSDKRRYDFYIKDMSLIIETHGIQHYSKDAAFAHENTRNEYSNDKYKRELALSNGIQNYIELDCKKSDFDYIYNSIMQSNIPILFDLSSVDWNEIRISSLKSNVIKACDVYNSGITSIMKIADILNLDISTVRDYLIRANDAGLCNYTTNKCKPVICVDYNKIYQRLEDVEKDGYNISQVSQCCNGKALTSGGCNWCFLDEYNPETYVMKKSNGSGTPKRILCIETGKIYEKQAYVEEDGFNPVMVSKVCKGLAKHHRHKHFKYI